MNELQVTVDLLGEADAPLGQKTLGVAAATGSTNLKSTGPVALEGARQLVVNVSHPGFTSYSRRIPATELVYLNADLLAVDAVTVSAAQTTSVSGAVTDGFTLSVPAVGGEGDIQVAIPRSLLPQGTTSLSAELKSFDPNDPQDAQYFPGDYADSDGNNLVSVAFNYADIRTNDGQPITAFAKTPRLAGGLPSVLTTAAAEATEPVIINRSIPTGSCATLQRLGDANGTMPGFQVPVYSYDGGSGLWVLLGYGTVFTSAGVRVDTLNSGICESGEYVLEIQVTSEIFLSKWWNLDYPLIFSQPVKYCANIRLQNAEAQTLNGIHGFLYGQTAQFGGNYFVTNEVGEARVEVEAEDVGSSLAAEITIFGESTFYSEVTLGRECVNPPLQVVTAQIPRLCQVHGKLHYPDGSPASKHPVLGVPEVFVLTDRFDFTSSDAAGDYWLNVTCGKDYKVTVYSYTEDETVTSVNVNGTTGASEISDNGDLATLATLTVDYVPTSIYSSGYSTVQNRLVAYTIAHPDAFPLRYNLRVENAAGAQLGVLQGELALNQGLEEEEMPLWYLGFGLIDAPLTLQTGNAALVYLRGTMTDSRNRISNVDIGVPVLATEIPGVSSDDEEEETDVED